MGSGVSLPGGRDNALSDFKPCQGRYPYRRSKVVQDTPRVLQLVTEKETFDVAVVGTTLQISLDEIAPKGARSFIVQTTHPYHIDVRYTDKTSEKSVVDVAFQTFYTFQDGGRLLLDVLRPANRNLQIVIDFDFMDHEPTPFIEAKTNDNPKNRYHFVPSILNLQIVYLSLDADTDRDGYIEHNSPFKDFWQWGTDGYGPILAMRGTNSRNMTSNEKHGQSDHREGEENYVIDLQSASLDKTNFSVLKVRAIGCDDLPPGYTLYLSLKRQDKQENNEEDETAPPCIAAYVKSGPGQRHTRQIMAPNVTAMQAEIPWPKKTTDSVDDGVAETEIFMQEIQSFDGTSKPRQFVPVTLSFCRGKEIIFEDSLELRICPWIIPSPLAEPHAMFFVDNLDDTTEFSDDLSHAASSGGLNVIPVHPYEVASHPDGEALAKWMMSGFTQTSDNVNTLFAVSQPQEENKEHTFIPGSQYEYFTLGRKGNFDKMMATPPIYPDFPLGALLVASLTPEGEQPGSWKQGKTEVGYIPKALGEFLDSQKVQPMVEIFTDWLETGDVTSMVNFVPCRSQAGFKIIMPSMYICRELLVDFRRHGEGFICEGKTLKGEDAKVQVTKILEDRDFWKTNQYFQNFIDWNRLRLRWQLGLRIEDFIEIPALWQLDEQDGIRAMPFFPNMTSLVVLGDRLVVPKPHGPKRKYNIVSDRFEQYLIDEFRASQVTSELHFVDDWGRCFDRGRATSPKSSLYNQVLVQRRSGAYPAWWQLEMR
ncbi:protein-arginine deiminase type-1-like [Glandiceps talaboti]